MMSMRRSNSSGTGSTATDSSSSTGMDARGGRGGARGSPEPLKAVVVEGDQSEVTGEGPKTFSAESSSWEGC